LAISLWIVRRAIAQGGALEMKEFFPKGAEEQWISVGHNDSNL